VITIVAAGITLHEALKAYDNLKDEGIPVRVIDLYSIKPIDGSAMVQAGRETGSLITVEDHVPEGGLGEAVLTAVSEHGIPVHCLAVRRMPRSGSPGELLDYEELSAKVIVRKVKELMKERRK
jgi:transketolase